MFKETRPSPVARRDPTSDEIKILKNETEVEITLPSTVTARRRPANRKG